MRRIWTAVIVGLVFAPAAHAETIVREDAKGRAITFDVQAANVDVGWFAALMRKTLHGDEIESVTIRIVPGFRLRRFCGDAAASCYSGDWTGGTVTVGAGRGLVVAAALRHEYAHHLDATYGLTLPAADGNRADRWWRARKIDQRLRRGQVAQSTRLGWQRTIREIFAEDFMRLHMSAPYRIHWIGPPGGTALTALRADVREALPTYS